jgi:hypothetical protein
MIQQEHSTTYAEEIRSEYRRMVGELGLGKDILAKGLKLIDIFEQLDIPSQLYPRSIAGIILYLVCRINQSPISKTILCSKLNMSKGLLELNLVKMRKEKRFEPFLKAIENSTSTDL